MLCRASRRRVIANLEGLQVPIYAPRRNINNIIQKDISLKDCLPVYLLDKTAYVGQPVLVREHWQAFKGTIELVEFCLRALSDLGIEHHVKEEGRQR